MRNRACSRLQGILLLSKQKVWIIVIHIIRTRATQQQMGEMLEMLGTYVKLAVDIQRRILAGGGAMYADCEALCSKMAVSNQTSGVRIGIRPPNKSRLNRSTFAPANNPA
jgi:hypothetical protein